MSKLIDLTNKRFGKLKVLKRAEDKIIPCGEHVVYWKCECECGKIIDVCGNSLKAGSQNSCGCICKLSWHIISPEGEHFYIKGLRGWLNEHAKEYFNCEPESEDIKKVYVGMVKTKENILSGKSKSRKYKGWEIVPTDYDTKKVNG